MLIDSEMQREYNTAKIRLHEIYQSDVYRWGKPDELLLQEIAALKDKMSKYEQLQSLEQQIAPLMQYWEIYKTLKPGLITAATAMIDEAAGVILELDENITKAPEIRKAIARNSWALFREYLEVGFTREEALAMTISTSQQMTGMFANAMRK